MPPTTETRTVLGELEALGYSDEDCITELTELVAGLLKRSRNDPSGHRARTHYRDALELADKAMGITSGEGSWRQTLAWACEEFSDQPEIEKLLKYLYDR